MRILNQGSVYQAIACRPAKENVAIRVGVDEAVGEAIAEAVGGFGPELRWKRELAAAKTENTTGADEEALVDVTASEEELRDCVWTAGDGGESERVLGEVADCDGAVAISNSVETIFGLLATLEELELSADGGSAFERGERGGAFWVKDGTDLLVALLAGLALEPEDVAACVDCRNYVLRRGSYLQRHARG